MCDVNAAPGGPCDTAIETCSRPESGFCKDTEWPRHDGDDSEGGASKKEVQAVLLAAIAATGVVLTGRRWCHYAAGLPELVNVDWMWM